MKYVRAQEERSKKAYKKNSVWCEYANIQKKIGLQIPL